MKQTTSPGIQGCSGNAESLASKSKLRRQFVAPLVEHQGSLESTTGSCWDIVDGVPVEVPCTS